MNVVLHAQYGHCLTSQTQPPPSRNHLHHTSQHGRSLASFPGLRERPWIEARQTTYNITDTSTGHLATTSHTLVQDTYTVATTSHTLVQDTYTVAMISKHTLVQATCGITHTSRDHYHTLQYRSTTILYPRADCVQHGVHGMMVL